jgi:hypothetical protein
VLLLFCEITDIAGAVDTRPSIEIERGRDFDDPKTQSNDDRDNYKAALSTGSSQSAVRRATRTKNPKLR